MNRLTAFEGKKSGFKFSFFSVNGVRFAIFKVKLPRLNKPPTILVAPCSRCFSLSHSGGTGNPKLPVAEPRRGLYPDDVDSSGGNPP